MKKIINWFKNLITLRQTNEDGRRKELILNILLLFSSVAFFIINIIRIIDYIIYTNRRGLPLEITSIIFIFFAFLLWLSRKGWLKTASTLLVATFALPMIYSVFTWGADLPEAFLLAILVIILSGILLGARSAFISTGLISLIMIFVTEQQALGLIKVADYWRSEPIQLGDALAYAVLLFIIATVAWLFCREINHSLKRARLSEDLLREERDSLEIKVEARTQELLNLEAEKIKQLYRLAEFGRLSSGIFHDLINPLTAVSLNLEQIKTETDNKVISAKSYLNQALLATNKMADLITSIKKQIARESSVYLFSLNQEIEQTIQILSYKARRAQVNIAFISEEEIKIEGDAIKFGQIITNLLANAIEACEETEVKEIILNLKLLENVIEIIVQDSGSGIAPENLTKIFARFFSTKKITGRGLGLGLAMTKEIIEKDFAGIIGVHSELNHGTTFTINFPEQNTLG
jgi:signal transduction histidine kinase